MQISNYLFSDYFQNLKNYKNSQNSQKSQKSQNFQKSQSQSRGEGLKKNKNFRGNLREITITLIK